MATTVDHYVAARAWQDANEAWVQSEIAVTKRYCALSEAQDEYNRSVNAHNEAEEVATDARYKYLDAIQNGQD
jgi:hypothetical protein